jgi:soluble lytic murein transglycosylase-like protein
MSALPGWLPGRFPVPFREPCAVPEHGALPGLASVTRVARTTALVAFILCGLPSAAQAQIYTWRDANGSLVLSDTPPPDSADSQHTYRVPNSSAPVLATRPVRRQYRDDYDDLIVEHARYHGIRPDLVRAVIQVESGYNPSARSPKGAMGLMQLMPGTAAGLGVTRPYDPEQNIRGGVAYLRRLLDRYSNDEELALAAYNAGPEAVVRYGNKVPPYRETREYVRKVRNRTSLATGAIERRLMYKTVEIVDGRPTTRWSNTKPESGPYEVWDATR